MVNIKKILILGGNNYLGIYLINELLKLGFNDIFVLNRGTKHNNEKVSVLVADRNNDVEMLNILANTYFDIIVDFSGYNNVHIENVLNHTSCLLYIFISSTAVYKPPIILPPDENYAFCSIKENFYGYNKWQAENRIIGFSLLKNFTYIILRPVYIYGLNDPYSRELIVFKQVLQNNIKIFGDGKNLIQFIYILDLTKIIIFFIKSPRNTILNVASPYQISINDYINLVISIVNKNNYCIEYIEDNTQIDYKQYSHFQTQIGLQM